MDHLISLLFLVAGAINLAPLSGALSSKRLQGLYRIGPISSDVELLLRHRAFLLGIVGSVIVFAAFLPDIRLVATISGLVSMISFIVLVLVLKSGNPQLIRVAWIDVAATLILLLGLVLHLAAGDRSS